MPLPGAWDMSSMMGFVGFGLVEMAALTMLSRRGSPKYAGSGLCCSRNVFSIWIWGLLVSLQCFCF